VIATIQELFFSQVRLTSLNLEFSLFV